MDGEDKKTETRAVTQVDLNNAKALIDGEVIVGAEHEFEVAEEGGGE